MSKKLISVLLMSALLVGLLATLGGCGATPAPTKVPEQPTVAPTTAPTTAAEAAKLILATTTSTADSGLLDFILPDFEQANNVNVEVIAVGTGQAIEIGSKGDADVLLVHSRKSEDKFVADGYAKERFDVMYNDFVIVGPTSDPAKIGGMTICSRRPQGDCRRGGHLCQPGRQVGHQHQGAEPVELGGHHPDDRHALVPVDRPGHGRHAALLAMSSRATPSPIGAPTCRCGTSCPICRSWSADRR